MTEWARYYDASGDDPRKTLLAAVERFAAPGLAVDLGCGTGRDTVELLRRGWHVVAIDSEEEAISRLHAKTGDDGSGDGPTRPLPESLSQPARIAESARRTGTIRRMHRPSRPLATVGSMPATYSLH